MWRGFVNRRNCSTIIESGYVLCTACKLRFASTPLRPVCGVTPLHNSPGATLHPGGHAPVRIQTVTPPTPIRLNVLDLSSILDAMACELWCCLDVIDALDWHKDPRMGDLKAMSIDHADCPRPVMFVDVGLCMATISDITRKIGLTLDPSEQRHEINTCELRATMPTAGTADQWVTRPVCGREQRAQTVKLRRLKTLCWDDSRRGSAVEIAKAFTDTGVPVRRGMLDVWVNRDKLPSSPQGPAYCDAHRLVIGGAA